MIPSHNPLRGPSWSLLQSAFSWLGIGIGLAFMQQLVGPKGPQIAHAFVCGAYVLAAVSLNYLMKKQVGKPGGCAQFQFSGLMLATGLVSAFSISQAAILLKSAGAHSVISALFCLINGCYAANAARIALEALLAHESPTYPS